MAKQFSATRSPSSSRWLPTLALLTAAAAAASACGSHTASNSSSSSATSTANGVKTVNVTLANDSGKDACKLDTSSVERARSPLP